MYLFSVAKLPFATLVLPVLQIEQVIFFSFQYSCLLSQINKLLAGVAGLEPAAPGFGDRCSTS